MNEIKEMLDTLKNSVDNPIIDVPTYDGSDSEPMDNIALLKPNACKQLLDYITNLQQENKAKTHQIEVLEEIVNYERNIRNDKLQQENEKLKYNTRGQVNDYFKNKYADEVLKNANLQQLYENGLKVNQNSHKYITELEMNNAILKEDLDKANDTIEKDRQFYKCRMDEYVDYKSRCEKAKEYIENNQERKTYYGGICDGEDYCILYNSDEVLNILNGSDEK